MGEIARGGGSQQDSDWNRRKYRSSRREPRRNSREYRDWDAGTRNGETRRRRDSRSRSPRGRDERRDRRDERRDWGPEGTPPARRGDRDKRDHERRDERRHERREEKKPRTPTPSESASSNSTRDDEIIHFEWEPGKPLGTKYTMKSFAGDGTFGRCLQCTDQKGRTIAIKVIRDIERYVENAKIEVEVLEAVRKADPEGRSFCVQLLETFYHRQFYCLAFEPLAGSLYDLLKENNYRGMHVADIQTIGEQTARALAFCASIDLTHTDLKPENILFQEHKMTTSDLPRLRDGRQGRPGGHSGPYLRPVRADIKVIDFGNATFAKDHHASIINTRQYRGPEVILGMSWDESSDIWSLGCILMELYGGELFFSTHENLEHMALMEKTLGPMPGSFTARARSPARGKLLNTHGRLNWPDGASNSNSVKHVRRTAPLPDQVLPVHKPLADIVKDMLQYEPSRRPTAEQVLRDPFFRDAIPEV